MILRLAKIVREIDTENSITALDSQQTDFEGEIFASEQELAGLGQVAARAD